MTDGYGWDGRVRYQGFAGLAWIGVELSGNIISNYRTFKCEQSERTYNFDYVKRKRDGPAITKNESQKYKLTNNSAYFEWFINLFFIKEHK